MIQYTLRGAFHASRHCSLISRGGIHARSTASCHYDNILLICNNTTSLFHQRGTSTRSYSAKVDSTQGQLIKKLRGMTGAPILDCKKALAATDRNFEEAVNWLRTNAPAKILSKVGGRDALQGLVGVLLSSQSTKGALVKVACETDFASKSPEFVSLVESVAHGCLQSLTPSSPGTSHIHLDDQDRNGNNYATLLNSINSNRTVQKALENALLSIRENVRISSASTMTADEDCILAAYVHGKVPGSLFAGTAAAIVCIGSSQKSQISSQEKMEEVGKRLAMHIVAAKPLYLSPAHVPEDVLQNEKDIILQQIMATAGQQKKKSPEIVEMMLTGKMRKFYERVCLTDQCHMIEDGNPKVASLLNELGLEVKGYVSSSISL